MKISRTFFLAVGALCAHAVSGAVHESVASRDGLHDAQTAKDWFINKPVVPVDIYISISAFQFPDLGLKWGNLRKEPDGEGKAG